MSSKKIVSSISLLAGLIFILSACGSSSDSTSSSSSTSTTSLSSSVPSDVVISSPTASTAASSSISVGKAALKPGDPDANDGVSKREALAALISTADECTFTLQMPTVTGPDCYGPRVNYSGHPGGSPSSGQLPVGDLGIWNPTEGATEACAAAQMNYLVDTVARRVDNMIKIFGSMACSGRKEGATLPAVGSSIDLKDEMTTRATVSGLTINSATLERLTDDGTNAVFKSAISTALSIGSESITGTVTLKHIPTSSDNSTYKGKAKIKMSMSSVQGCGGDGVIAGTVLYQKSSATSVVYELNFADFCGSSTDPFDSNGNIDPTDKYNASTNPDGWVHNWNYGLFSTDPTNDTGTYSYAWQAGASDGRTRVLNVTTSGTGAVTGTAYYGFGPDIAASSGKGTIDGFVCNWTGPGGATAQSSASATALLAAGKGWNKAQKQTLSRASGATIFTAPSSSILYSPEDDCNSSAGDGFTYNAVNSAGTALSFSNDRTSATTAITNDLINLSDIVFTMPTAPADISI